MAVGNRLTASIDEKQVFDYTDSDNPHFSGRVKLGSGYYQTQISQITVTKPQSGHLISKRLDDLDAAITYKGNWQHVCGLGNTKWNRTLSTATADDSQVPTFDFDFTGTGFSLIGQQAAKAALKIAVDGVVIDWNLVPQIGVDGQKMPLFWD